MAGIRQETISRLESGKHTATPGTIAKIDRVVAAARKRLEKREDDADIKAAGKARKEKGAVPRVVVKKRLGRK